MIDVVYLAWNRIEFTKQSIQALIANTEWAQVRKLVIYDDGSTDGTREYLSSLQYPVAVDIIFRRLGGPVAITNNYLSRERTELFAKIDNDTMVPPGWLAECLRIVETHKELDLLGIEPFYPVQAGKVERGYAPAKHIGGIGLMRRRCFRTLPRPNGRNGFTGWQHANKQVIKGWVNPSLPVFLLDRIHFEPWVSLSRRYVMSGWQRVRSTYDDSNALLWNWWKV